MSPGLSAVIPVYNEEANVGPLMHELVGVLRTVDYDWETVWVDDGSLDGTFSALEKARKQLPASEQPRIRLVRLARNSGQTAALSAGLDHSRGDIIVTLDGDGQNDPADIPALLETLDGKSDDGRPLDLVCGWRSKRKEPLLSRRIPSALGNWFVKKMTAIPLHDIGCTLKAFRRHTISDIYLYGQTHRLLPVMLIWKGARFTEVEVNDRPRNAGESKYSLYRSVIVLLDLITLKFFLSYATRPLHIFGLAGLLCMLISMVALAGVVLMKVTENVDMTGNPLLTITVVLIIVGVQFMVLGLLGEVSVRTYYESQNKPTYHVVELIGNDGEQIRGTSPVREIGQPTKS